MRKLTTILFSAACCLAPATLPAAAPPPAPYTCNLDKAEEGKLPDDLLVLGNAQFTIVKQGDHKVIQLPGSPLESFGLLAGPEFETGTITAHIRAESAGKRYPEFGIGLNGASGYKLWIMPATGQVQLIKGEEGDQEVKASAPYPWQSGAWTALRLQIRPQNGKYIIEGKAWPAAQPEPPAWTLTTEDPDQPQPNRASLWGVPYSDLPLHFDQITVTPK